MLPELHREYNPDDIYNAGETGLYYRTRPDGSLCYAYEQLSSSKKAMEHITVLCCANMSGRNKCKLLVTGKSKKPRCFAGINVESLPVIYQANKNAWMTSVLFEEWITNWDAALMRESRKILLLVDNCTAHATLQNIRLEFYHPTQPHSSNPWIRESSNTPQDLLQEGAGMHDSCCY